jgi:hypothetical protein
MIVVLFTALALMLAGQADKPCDKRCFAQKVGKEMPSRDGENTWRYRHDRDGKPN